MVRKTIPSGSPPGEPEYLVIGFLRRPHGVKGEILMDLHTDFPERLKIGRTLFLGDAHTPAVLTGARSQGAAMLVQLQGVGTPEAAGKLRNTWVSVRRSDVPGLPAGQIYQHDLIGLSVVDEESVPLGRITEIIETGANDVYVVTPDKGAELLLPAIPSVILDLDLAARRMRVHVLDGLRGSSGQDTAPKGS